MTDDCDLLFANFNRYVNVPKPREIAYCQETFSGLQPVSGVINLYIFHFSNAVGLIPY